MDVSASCTQGGSREFALRRVDARDFRKEIIALYARNGNSIFESLFDWYYRDVGQNAPASWILASQNGGGIAGVCSVTTREFRFGEMTLMVGVLGNFLVDKDMRKYFGAVRLVKAAKSLVDSGEFDILLGLPNQLAQPLLLRLGFQHIDSLQTQAQVFRSSDALRYRFGPLGAFASPIVDSFSALRRLFSAWPRTVRMPLRILELSEDQLAHISTTSWSPPAETFVLQSSGAFLRSRFFQDPVKRYRGFAIVDAVAGDACGFLIAAAAAGRLHISACSTDSRRLSETEAILAFCSYQVARGSTVWVTTLQGSRLFEQLSRCGSYRVPGSFGGWSRTPLVGYWKTAHPLAEHFGRGRSWSLLVGFNDV